MTEPMNLDQILLPGLKGAVYEALDRTSTVAELEQNLQQLMATVTQVNQAFLSPGARIRAGLSQQKGGTS